MSKTTERHFEWFKQSVRKWMKKLHVDGWDVYFRHQDIGESYARIVISGRQRHVVFELTDEWDDTKKISRAEIDETALWEVCRLFLLPVVSAGKERFITENDIDLIYTETTIRLMALLKER